MEHTENKYPQIVSDLAAVFAEFFQERKIDDPKTLAWDTAVLVSKELAGQQPYWGRRHLISERDMRIYKQFTGSNYATLAKDHNLTERQIYNIVGRCQQEEFERNQLKLF